MSKKAKLLRSEFLRGWKKDTDTLTQILYVLFYLLELVLLYYIVSNFIKKTLAEKLFHSICLCFLMSRIFSYFNWRFFNSLSRLLSLMRYDFHCFRTLKMALITFGYGIWLFMMLRIRFLDTINTGYIIYISIRSFRSWNCSLSLISTLLIWWKILQEIVTYSTLSSIMSLTFSIISCH